MAARLDYDVIVIGSRIAGAVAATLLARGGQTVLVLDRAHFPSDTLSTHFFRYPTFNVLQRLGVLEEVSATAPKLVENFNDVDGHVFTEPVQGPDGPSHTLCVRRITLDDILVRRLKKESRVVLREGTSVTDLVREQDRIAGVRWSKNGTSYDATARVVIGADGVHSLVAKLVQPAVERSEPVRRAMYYAYFAGFEPKSPPAAEFHYRGDRLVYVFPTDGGLTLLAVSVPIGEFGEFRKKPEQQFQRELEAMPELVDRLRRSERIGPVRGTGTIPGWQRFPFGPGWVLAGDAEQILDPWSGQGIDQASTHAALVADALCRWLGEDASWEDAMQEYNRQRHAFSDATFERTCLFARDFRPMTEAALRKRGYR